GIGLDRRLHAGERDVLGQHHRQLVFRHRYRPAGRAIDHRDRTTPVALAADAPVAQAPVDPARAAAIAFESRGQRIQRPGEVHAVVLAGIDQDAAWGPGGLLANATLEFLDHPHRRGNILRIDAAAFQRGEYRVDADAQREVVLDLFQRG